MSEHITESHETKRLRRSRSNRMLAGVCGGLAEYFEIHPAVFRVAFVVIALLPGAGILIYLAAVLVIPDEGREDSIAGAVLRERRNGRWPLIGLGLVAVAGAMLVLPVAVWPRDALWWVGAMLLFSGAVILWIARRDAAGEGATDASARAAEDSRRLRRLLRWLAAAVAAIAALLGILAAVFIPVFDVHLDRGIGERSHVVTSTQNLRSEYWLGIGDLGVDLRSLPLPLGETAVEVRVDVGALRVIVPDNVALRVRADAQLGTVDLLGEAVEGYDVEERLDQAGPRVLVLDAHVGVGSLDVKRALP